MQSNQPGESLLGQIEVEKDFVNVAHDDLPMAPEVVSKMALCCCRRKALEGADLNSKVG